MTLDQLLSEIEQLYTNRDLRKIFKILQALLYRKSKIRERSLRLSMRYNIIQDQIMSKSKAYNHPNENIYEIGDQLMGLIRSLDASDIDPSATYNDDKIQIRLLVLSTEAEIENLADFFQRVNFSNTDVQSIEKDNYNYDKYDLIIYDNRDLPIQSYDELPPNEREFVNRRTRKMTHCIQNSSKLLIHFGHKLFWVNFHRDRVQAANSKFSLHARIHEVMDFMDAYRV